MNVFRGQIWTHNETHEPFFVCGSNDTWTYHTALDFSQRRRYQDYSGMPWRKDKTVLFEKRYTFTKHAIASKGYWKSKANGDMVQVLGIKDDGWCKVYILYDLNKIPLNDFYEYFEPCTRIEVLLALAREKRNTKKLDKMKRRIFMTPGRHFDPGG